MPCRCGCSECGCTGICCCNSEVCRCERCGVVPLRKRHISPTKMEAFGISPVMSRNASGSGQAICQPKQIVLKESLSTVLREPSKKAFRTETVIKYAGSRVSPQKRKRVSPSSTPGNDETVLSPSKKDKSSAIHPSNVPKVTASPGSSQGPGFPRAQIPQRNPAFEQLRMDCSFKWLIAVKFQCGYNTIHNCRTGCVRHLPMDSSPGTSARSSNFSRFSFMVNRFYEPTLNRSSPRAFPPTRQRGTWVERVLECDASKPRELVFDCGDREIHDCRLSGIQSQPIDYSQQSAASRPHGSSFDEKQSQEEPMDVAGPSNTGQDSASEQLPRREKHHDDSD